MTYLNATLRELVTPIITDVMLQILIHAKAWHIYIRSLPYLSFMTHQYSAIITSTRLTSTISKLATNSQSRTKQAYNPNTMPFKSKKIIPQDGRCHMCNWHYSANAWIVEKDGSVKCPTSNCTYKYMGAYPWEPAPIGVLEATPLKGRE
jgi:hypothetical protein